MSTSTNATPRRVVAKERLQQHRMTASFSSYGLRGQIRGHSIDPFLNLDDFEMSQPTFPPHPHAGFSAVTYMFEDSDGAFVNRDSLGDRSVIAPGGFHWTQAARGMLHEEIPEHPGRRSHGLQMFVNLAAVNKHSAPRAFHLEPSQIAEHRPQAGVRVRVLAGSVGDVHASLDQLLTPIQLLDIHLAANQSVTLPLRDGDVAFLMAIAGAGVVSDGSAEQSFEAHDAVHLGSTGTSVVLRAGAHGVQLLLGSGRALNEPVVAGGPFVMNTRDEINDAFARYRRGEMGTLAPSFEPG